MFAATRRWFRRNRTPIAIGVGVVGAGYAVTSYILNKLNDARERMSSDRIAKENLRRRFEQNQEDCTFTVLALLPTATANILDAMNTEKITYEIQQMKGSATARARSIGSTSPPSTSELTTVTDEDGRSIISLNVQSESGIQTSTLSVPTPLTSTTREDTPQTPPPKARKTKKQLWNDLTISSITRAYTLLYTLGLLTMLTRVQLNLLGRRSYLSSVVSLATGGTQATISLENNDDDSPEQAYGSDFEVNRKYLTFSWWLLNRGWVDIMQRVEASVRQVFGHLSPRDSVTFDTFARLTNDVRHLVEGSSPGTGAGTRWLPFLLPAPNMEEFVLRESGVDPSADPSFSPSPTSGSSLRRLLDETSDLIESPVFAQVLTQILDAGFSTLLNKKVTAGAFEQHIPTVVEGADVAPTSSATITNRAVLLPKILSVLTRQAHVIGNGMPNEYLQAMESVRDLEGFAAVVYSSNWQAEIAHNDEPTAYQSQYQPQYQQQYTQPPTPYYSAPPSVARSVQGDDVAPAARLYEQRQEESQSRSLGAPTESSSLVLVDIEPVPEVEPPVAQATVTQEEAKQAEASFDSAWERAFEKQGDTQEQVPQQSEAPLQSQEQEQVQVQVQVQEQAQEQQQAEKQPEEPPQPQEQQQVQPQEVPAAVVEQPQVEAQEEKATGQ